jgi:hypothetical protein
MASVVVTAGLVSLDAQPPAGQGGRGGRGVLRPAAPRDGSPTSPLAVGTGIVSGTVTIPGTGAPARRARIVLNAFDGEGTRTAMTDDNGQYAFVGLPAARYSLSASKPGHVGVTFGQTRPGRPGTPIQLGEGEKFTAHLQLPKGSVVTGTVLDEHGEPAPGTQVRALRYGDASGRRRLLPSAAAATDDRGIYRIYGLQPGDYLVSAVPRNAGAAPGRMEMQAELLALRERLAAGTDQPAAAVAMRGKLLEAMQESFPSEDAPSTGYAPVFYPGTTTVTDAAPITLGLGEERASVDFQLQRVPLARIEGVVLNSTGQPTENVQLTLLNAVRSDLNIGVISTRADVEGRFRLTNVPPGNYRLVARANAAAPGAPPDAPRRGRGGRAGGPPLRLWGSLDVMVDGRNLSNVVVALQQGLTVSGRIQFNGTSLPPPSDLTRMRVVATPAERPFAANLTQTATGTVDASGRFTVPGVLPGAYRITASGAGNGWSLESSVVGGQDSLDFPVEISPAQAVTGGVITFTDRRTQLSGTITNERGQPAPSFTLILYAADEQFWGPQSRRILPTRPDTDGRFTFSGFPPGDYKLVALADVETGAWFDPAFLQQMEGAAISITVAEGERKVQSIQVAGP